MKVLVCGGRDYADRQTLFAFLDSVANPRNVEVVIEGEAPGADTLAREWAEQHRIPVLMFPAEWKIHGKAAGPIRNAQMLREGKPDLVVAFPTPASRGTWHMVRIAREAGVRTLICPRVPTMVTA